MNCFALPHRSRSGSPLEGQLPLPRICSSHSGSLCLLDIASWICVFSLYNGVSIELLKGLRFGGITLLYRTDDVISTAIFRELLIGVCILGHVDRPE